MIPGRLAAPAGALLVLLLTAVGATPASAASCASTETAGGEWRSYGHDYANTRFQEREKVISPGDVPLLAPTWTFSTVEGGGTGDITGTPIVADGCVYAATTQGWVFALNADTGELVWKTELPYGGGVFGSLAVVEERFRVRVRRRNRASRRRARSRRGRSRPSPQARGSRSRRRARARRKPKTKLVTRRRVYLAASRLQPGKGCPQGDPCLGPYVVALDQETGRVAWATPSLDSQPGADVYGSPVVFDRTLLIGISGGVAELGGDEADRYAFQGSMVLLDTAAGRVLRKTWTIHPPKQPDDDFAGAGVWSTPAIDPEKKVAYAGTANPFRPQKEHQYANSVLKYDLDRGSRRFGEIIGSFKGNLDEYFPGFSELPCYDFPGNNPPYYPQGLGACGDIDMDFGAAPNLFTDAGGRKLVGAGQKSGVYHVFDAQTMKPVWSQAVGPPTSLGGIVGSTAYDGHSIYGPVTVPGYLWSVAPADGAMRWLAPVVDAVHWGNPVAVANSVVYTVDLTGFLDAFDARSGLLLTKRPLALGATGPVALSWAGVSIARNTVYAAVGIRGLSEGYIVAFRPGGTGELGRDIERTVGRPTRGSGGGSGGGGTGSGFPIIAGPGASSSSYATPFASTEVNGSLSFANLDIAQHDVTADEKGPDGMPLFSTPLIGLGESTPLRGLDRVSSGHTYSFYCTLHPGMRGQLIVR